MLHFIGDDLTISTIRSCEHSCDRGPITISRTPLRRDARSVALEIDGRAVAVPEGTSVIRAAAEAGIHIPKLCATDSLEPFGSCRLCLVEIEGQRGYPASCTTPVRAGMKVRTESPALARLRRGVMELYISDHPLDCLTCPANGNCELQDMAGAVGLREVRYRNGDGANHLHAAKDESNPYFTFDPSKCIVCSRCVRACEEVQGTFALTIDGRGFSSVISPGQNGPFSASECVSCGACVQACPTATLMEKSVVELGQPDHSVVTTCGYCGVGCSFRAEMKGDLVARMVPNPNGQANHGHSCVKGRFAWGYTTHPDRVTRPLIRKSIDQPWREVSWREAIEYAASEFRRIQEEHGRGAVGAITSSRCTNEETFLVQKLVRAAFGNNNVDTCARVCHSPTGYGLKTAFGTSATTQDFESVMQADVIMVIGANVTEGHPVFAAQMKRRIRQGAKLIVVDPRVTEIVRLPHVQAAYHLQIRPGTNVALINAIAHVVVTEGLADEEFAAARCDPHEFEAWKNFVAQPHNSPESVEKITGVPAAQDSSGCAFVCDRAQRRYLLRPWRHRAQPGQHDGVGYRESRDGDRQYRAAGSRRESSARTEQRAGLVRHGFVPARVQRLSPYLRRCGARDFRRGVGRARRSRTGPAHSQHVRRGARRQLQGSLCAGRRRRAVRAQRPSRRGGAERDGMRRGAGFIFQRDGEICACVSAGFVVPREERHFHQQRAANLDGAQGRGAARRQGRLGNHLRACDRARLSDEVCASVGNHGRDRAADAHFFRRQLRKDRAARLRPMAMQRRRTRRHSHHACRSLRTRQRPLHDYRVCTN